MLERRTALKRFRPGPQPQAEINQDGDQKQRGCVEQPAKLPCRCPRCGLTRQHHGAQHFLVLLSRHGAHGLQGIVDRGEKVMKQSSVCQQRSDGIGITGEARLPGDFIQPVLDLARSR